MTVQVAHTARATRAPFAPRAGMNVAGSIPRHAAWECHEGRLVSSATHWSGSDSSFEISQVISASVTLSNGIGRVRRWERPPLALYRLRLVPDSPSARRNDPVTVFVLRYTARRAYLFAPPLTPPCSMAIAQSATKSLGGVDPARQLLKCLGHPFGDVSGGFAVVSCGIHGS